MRMEREAWRKYRVRVLDVIAIVAGRDEERVVITIAIVRREERGMEGKRVNNRGREALRHESYLAAAPLG